MRDGADPDRREAAPQKLILVAGLTLGYWAGFVLLATSYAVLRGFLYKAENRPIDILLVLTGTAISLIMMVPLRRLARFALPAQVATAAILVFGGAVIFEGCFRLVLYLVAGDLTPETFALRPVLIGSIYWLAPLGLWSAMYLASFHHAEMRVRERRLAAVQIEAHEAHVRALRYQVSPHFLYNTLNSIAALILDRRTDRAEEMVLRLGAFFRASLENDPLRDVTLEEELAIQRHYLAVEELRFDQGLRVEYEVPDDVQRALVPNLILQPIVENSVKHGARDGGEDLHIRIAARKEGANLLVEVRNNGAAEQAASGTGIGLANVASRLATRFGAGAAIETQSTGNEFLVRLTMPFQQA